jgi:hypothetical protein
MGGEADLVCLGGWAFCFGKGRLSGLEKLGFSWILSSESRLINGLRGIFHKNFFSAPSSLMEGARHR